MRRRAARTDAPHEQDGSPQEGSGASGATGGSSSAKDAATGVECSSSHGFATLTSYDRVEQYAASAFSFEYASQDATLTHNEFDVLYTADLLRVNTVVDDRSFIVDLGDVSLRNLPRQIDPDAYPVGQWGEHDAVQAQLNHVYWVRSVDNAGRMVSAFRVTGLNPGRLLEIEWIRSTDTDTMVAPTSCLF